MCLSLCVFPCVSFPVCLSLCGKDGLQGMWTAERNTADQPSYWWILGLVVAGLIVALAAMFTFLKLRGKDGLQGMWTDRHRKKTA